MNAKLKTMCELYPIVQDLKRGGKKVVFTNGCFDLLHIGHIRCLTAARQEGDILVVGLNSDASVKNIKSKSRPIIREENRAEVLAALSMVDYIILFDDLTPIKLIMDLYPDVLVKGGDYQDKLFIAGADYVKYYGGRVVCTPLIISESTTSIITTIVKRYR